MQRMTGVVNTISPMEEKRMMRIFTWAKVKQKTPSDLPDRVSDR